MAEASKLLMVVGGAGFSLSAAVVEGACAMAHPAARSRIETRLNCFIGILKGVRRPSHRRYRIFGIAVDRKRARSSRFPLGRGPQRQVFVAEKATLRNLQSLQVFRKRSSSRQRARKEPEAAYLE